jgi:hypothetical protein
MNDVEWLVLLEFLVGATCAFVGCAAFYWSKPMSRKYNAWTTAFRTRFPQINKPPDARHARSNYEIMVGLFCVLGAALLVGGGFILIDATRNLVRVLRR